jgi:hypothetical protein
MKPHNVSILLALVLVIGTAPAADPPDFIAGWRVSGVVSQGGKLQACLENSGRFARYVREGDELMPGVIVEKIDKPNRSVTVRRDQQVAVIRPGSAPVPATVNTALAQAQQQAQQKPGGSPWGGGPATAGQDEKGRWGVKFGNGGFFSAQDYAQRFGGVQQAIEHSKKHLAEDTDPNRRAFHEQMLSAMQNTGNAKENR